MRAAIAATVAASALALLLSPTHPVLAAPASAQEAVYSFAFENADVAQVAEEVLGAIGARYSIDPSVSGKITFRIDQRLTRPQLLQAFEAALATSNIAIVPSGDTLVVTSQSKARSAAVVRPSTEGVRRAGYEVVAVPLSYAVPSEVAKALEAITGSDQVLYASDKLGLLVLAGSGAQLQSTLESVKVLDQGGLETSRLRWYELSQAPASQVAAELEDLLKAAGISSVRVAPLKRLNGIILIGTTDKVLSEVAQWMPRLDAPTSDAASSLWVYRPRNASAEALARTLNEVLGSQSTVQATQTTPSDRVRPSTSETVSSSSPASFSRTEAEDLVRAAVDKETNTLLVSAPAWRWVQIQRILAEIDRPQPQILIEGSVLEVSLRKEFRAGVDWSKLATGDGVSVRSIGNAQGSVGPTYPGFSVTFLEGDFAAAINALGSKTDVDVVSAESHWNRDINEKVQLMVAPIFA